MIQNELWNLKLSSNGKIETLHANNKDTALHIDFRKDAYGGPAWYGLWDEKEHLIDLQPMEDSPSQFVGQEDGIQFTLEYRVENDHLVINAGMLNLGDTDFEPVKAGLKLGLDTYMESFPEWDNKFFPTLLRCEATHFWGYAMSPLGNVIGIASPDPIASWSLDYNRINEHHNGHRIYTFNLDFLNKLPLPERHPQHLTILKSGEKREWTVHLTIVNDLNEVQSVLSKLCSAPMISLDKYTLMKDELTQAIIYSDDVCSLKVTSPSGREHTFDLLNTSEGVLSCKLLANNEEYGVFTVNVESSQGKIAEAKYYRRKPWSWYLKQARVEAINKPQKATTHLEAWYGHFSSFLARKHFPDSELDRLAEDNFRQVLALMFDIEKGEPISEPGRACNSAVAVSMLTDVYEAKGDLQDLELASKLADSILSDQHEDGSYRAYTRDPIYAGVEILKDGLHYTSVYYMAKSILELALVEKELGHHETIWRERYERHYQSAKAAIYNLEKLKDNIGTEGEHTFEDGMISCTSLQLGMYALLQDDPHDRKLFTEAALTVLNKHRCLEQLIIPDCRMRGCTLRFWESQYDVLMDRNMINSPHGWSSWKTYATWYLYLLTGEERWLIDTMDTLGACIQQLDIETGNLRWAFICDPSVTTGVWEQDEANPGKGKRTQRVIGEQYADMISGWWKAPSDQLVGAYLSMPLRTRDGFHESDNQGGCCDNDVHEHFKCLEEIALTSAYIIERDNGEIVSWNCCVIREGTVVNVYLSEDVINAVHVNFIHAHEVEVHFNQKVKEKVEKGMHWIRTTPLIQIHA